MGKKIVNELVHSIPFWVCLGVSVLLIVAGFLVPPTGVLDPSVLTAVGELFGFATLYVVMRCVEKGIDAKIKKGNTELTIGDLNNEPE